MLDQIQQLQSALSNLVASTPEEAEQLRIAYLGKKGRITQLFEAFRQLPPEEKRQLGAALNELKQEATARIKELLASVATQSVQQTIDLTRTLSTRLASPAHAHTGGDL